jgi:lipopolysaccharide transport system ATP-binding protein
MRRTEIKRKFDEIVAFAEVEKFLDTPVKRYSSGMYVRLAFAVAAHLEPEILVVDEVLAVGDAEFQKKCLGKMQDVATKEGRTVLFVSHNLAAILNLCSKGVLLQQGQVALTGEINSVCSAYTRMRENPRDFANAGGILRGLHLTDETGQLANNLTAGERLRFQCAIKAGKGKCLLSLIVRDAYHAPLFELHESALSVEGDGDRDLSFQIEAGQVPLRPGTYSVDFWCGDRFGKRLEWLERALEFEVVASPQTECSIPLLGPFWFPSKWQTTQFSK